MSSLRPDTENEIGSGPADLWIGLLGPFEVRQNGRAVQITSDRLRGILAVLASSAGSTVSLDTIGEYVWADEPPVNLRRTVQTWIARLRRLLPDDVIVSRPGGYSLTLGPDRIDAQHFGQLLDAAASTADPDAERQILAQALGLWRGTPYEGAAAGRLESLEATRLTELYLAALERAADLALAAGDVGEQAPRLHAEVERHPLRESLWARHLRVLAGSGRSAQALAGYETLRRRLVDELGADPSAELQQIHADLLNPGPPATAELRVERPRQLPADIELVGRADALDLLDRALAIGDPNGPGTVVAAITGQGGAGKTSLAVHWAHRRETEFPDGQLFIDMRGFAAGRPVDPVEALGVLLGSLGVPTERIPASADARAALYRTVLADRRVLVILDNVRDSEQVRPLLTGSPGRVIVTSRGALRGLSAREGARRVVVGQLPPKESELLLDTRFRRQGMIVDASTVTELASLCAHLPLALVIAAEYVARHQSDAVDASVWELRDERGRLEALDDDGDDPSASVRSVFSWSIAALDPSTARAFRLVAYVIPMDFSPDLAAAVAGLPVARMRRILDHLADASLVTRSAGRFRLHDLVRMYAAERAEAEDAEADRHAASRRGLDWYLHTLHNAMELLKPSGRGAVDFGEPADSVVRPLTFDDVVTARRWCASEHRALVFVTRRAYEFGRYEHAWRLSWELGRFLLMTPYSNEVVEIGRVGVSAAKQVGEVPLYVAHLNLACAYGKGGQWAESLASFGESLAGCRSAGDVGAECVILTSLAVTLHDKGDLGEALRHAHAALDAANRWQRNPAGASKLSPNLAACHLNLGYTLSALERYPEGIAHSEQAFELARKSGNRVIEGMSQGNLAWAYALTGDYAEAESHNIRALALLREIGAEASLVSALLIAGKIKVATDRPDEARAAYDEAVAILKNTDDPRIAELNAALAR